MKKISLFFIALVALFTSCKNNPYADLGDGLFANIETSKGDIIVKLEYKKTPITVANFVSLAEGKNQFVEEKFKNKPFYDGLKFHRVIADFMIQGGDPMGTGEGGPGYKFKDEFDETLKHNKGGILSMANAGPGTNGSQFFITHKETPHLDNLHTIFGEVVKGMENVNSIVQDDLISKVTIIRNGSDAEKFDAEKTFNAYYKDEAKALKIAEEKAKKISTEKEAYLIEKRKEATKTASGLEYVIINKGTGAKPKVGTQVFVNYAGYFENGDMFDTSYETIAEQYGRLDDRRKEMKGYQPFPFQYGEKKGLIPGFIEALENMKFGDKVIAYIPYQLGYGEQANGPIPAKSNLIFEIEMLEKAPQY
ncbi:peptidylprolyl isomerase [Flavobacterium gelidilacus]|uniref:peptidylprolyl isomerase n=1 Tax=Flavobacterium gelidilacus TaxID=206041 RepID=UPI00041EDA01|nr:peptidylprolyl isomerase [Flavobacterium gelidilacus]